MDGWIWEYIPHNLIASAHDHDKYAPPTFTECPSPVPSTTPAMTQSSEAHKQIPPSNLNIKIMHLNAQSCCNKSLELADTIVEERFDMVLLSETWFKEVGDEPRLVELTPNGFVLKNLPRQSGRGGGLAILYREGLANMVNIRPSSSSMSTFSMCELRIQHRHRTLTIVFMYRPPPSKGNKLTSKLFVQEFQDLLDCYISTKDLFVIGDFNLHFESNSETYATQVKRALKERNLDQLISVPTHVRGHTIDWLVTNAPDLIANLTVEDKALSDHFLVSFVLKLSKPRNPRKIITSRKLKNINTGIFGSDAAALLSQPGSADLCTHYTTCLKTLLDSHAPLITRTVPDDHQPHGCRTTLKPLYELDVVRKESLKRLDFLSTGRCLF